MPASAAAQDFVAGCVSGVTCVAVGYPFDTLKVRLQANSTYTGVFDCFSHIVKKEGLLSLFKGMSSPAASISFINAAVFLAYGQTKRLLNNQHSSISSQNFHLGVPKEVADAMVAGLFFAVVAGLS